MQVSDIVKTNVVTSFPDATLIEIANLMQENGVGSVIIIDKKFTSPKPSGILNELREVQY